MRFISQQMKDTTMTSFKDIESRFNIISRYLMNVDTKWILLSNLNLKVKNNLPRLLLLGGVIGGFVLFGTFAFTGLFACRWSHRIAVVAVHVVLGARRPSAVHWAGWCAGRSGAHSACWCSGGSGCRAQVLWLVVAVEFRREVQIRVLEAQHHLSVPIEVL